MKKLFSFLSVCLLACIMSAQDYNTLINEAMACIRKDSLERAEYLYKEALKLDPSGARNALLFSNLGTVQQRQGKIEEAIESYTMALNMIPYSTTILLNRAALYLEQGDQNKAYVDYCSVIDLLPENAEARLYRAFIYMQRRQYKEARIDYNTILTKNPEHAEALLGLAYLNQKERQYKEAMSILNRLVKAHPEEPAYLKARVNLAIEMGNMDLALLDVEMLERKGKDDGESWLLKGDILLQQKKKKKALEAYRKALEKGISPLEVQDKIKACR